MPSRDQALDQIGSFLSRRKTNYDESERQLSLLSREQANAVVSRDNYFNETKCEFTVKELSELISSLTYSNIHWALFGSVDSDIKNKRQPRSLTQRGILAIFTRPATYRFEPNLLSRPADVIKIETSRPELIEKPVDNIIMQEIEVEKECTRLHFSPDKEAILKNPANFIGWVDGVLVNDSTGDPVVALGFLSQKEINILHAATGFDYQAYEQLKEPRES